MDYLKDQIITYIGNKRKILPFIQASLDKIGMKNYHFLDLFSGSGIVSRLAKVHGASKITANDLEYYSSVLNTVFLRNKEGDKKNFEEAKKYLLSKPLFEGWVSKNYAPKDDNNIQKGERCFYTRENALLIDSYSQLIFNKGCYFDWLAYAMISFDTAILLLASLIVEASIHTNTSGVFKGFYKNKQGIGQFGGEGKNALQRILGKIDPEFPVFCPNQTENTITQLDAADLIKQNDEYDITYIDPPYNQHPYGSNYFMLNAIAKNECPKEMSVVSGIPKDWNRSIYNKRREGVERLLKDIEEIKSKYVILSYSSEAYLPIKDMVGELAKIGLITNLDEIDYNVFRGSRNLAQRKKKLQEYLITIRK